MGIKKTSRRHDAKLEEKIKNEIQQRVLEENEELGEEIIHVDDMVEALKEITAVPPDEIDKIAREVRAEYTAMHERHAAQKKKLQKPILIVGAAALIIVAVFSAILYRNYQQTAAIAYTSVFTSGVSDTSEPIDRLTEVPITIDQIYLFVTWMNLTEGDHHYRIRVFDGGNTIAWESKWRFHAKGGTQNTWSRFNPKENINLPGRWKFEIFLDERKIVEEYLMVVSTPSG